MCCSRWGRGHELYELVYVGTVLVVGTLVESALAEVATLGLKTSLKAQGDCVPDDLVKLGGAGRLPGLLRVAMKSLCLAKCLC